jgi:plasmid stabilization system protein ParE
MPSNSYQVIWSPEAALDLEEIILDIAEENPKNASTIFERIHKRVNSLKRYPKKGVIVPELKNFGILSYLQVVEIPWRLIYRISENSVYIFALVHGKRDMEQFLLKRLTR